MIERPDILNLIEKFPKNRMSRISDSKLYFWIASSNYYVMAIAVSIAAFFLVWGWFNGSSEHFAWVTAGFSASSVLIASVVLRSILFRRWRQQMLEQRNLEMSMKNAHLTQNNKSNGKLTIEENSIVLKEIEKKSKAARILEKLPEGHLEVFEMCDEYLRRIEIELDKVGVGSPRLPVLRKSKEEVVKFHKYHLLAWASVESRLLIQKAENKSAVAEKLARSQKALNVLDSAVRFYPDESLLTDSVNAVKEYIATVKVKQWIDQAKRAMKKGNYKRASNCYQDALFFLQKENRQTPETEMAIEKINDEMQKLAEIKGKE